VDVDVDELTDWKGVMAMGEPNRLERAFEQKGAMPLSASELARCFPDLWPSEGAVKQYVRRFVRGYESVIEILLRFRTPLNLVRYRRAGQRCPSPAAICADAPDPRAALESVVGPVVWFEIEEPTQAEEVQQVDTPTPQAEPVTLEAADLSLAPVDLGQPALTVVPFRPPAPPPAPLESSRVAFVLAKSRLAHLVTRLERFKPSPEPVPRRAANG
jgi:hypothetical protein